MQYLFKSLNLFAFKLHKMNATFITTLSIEELQVLIEGSVKKALQITPLLTEDTDTLLDTKEAAALIRYEISSIYGLVKRRKIPFCKVEGKLLFSRFALLEWIAATKQNAIGQQDSTAVKSK